MRRALAIVSICLAAAVGACGDEDEKESPGAADTTPTQPTTETQPQAGGDCEQATEPGTGERRGKKPGKLDADKTYRLKFTTNCGEFTIELDPKSAPNTTSSLVELAEAGFFDGTTFHRIVPNFVIQGGDPQGTGQGGPGYEVVEAPPPNTRYTRGVVAMAKTEIDEPGTSGSQFYVVTAPDAQLPADYAVLGRVSAGQEVVDVIGALPTDQANPDPSQRESPVNPVVIRAVRIDEKR